MLSILMQLARIEREFLIQRVKSGLNHAKAKGKVLGRPKNSVMDQQVFLKSIRIFLQICKTVCQYEKQLGSSFFEYRTESSKALNLAA